MEYSKLDAEDAKKTTVPHIILASKGEDAAEVQKCKEVLEGEGKPGVVETYGTQQHGWSMLFVFPCSVPPFLHVLNLVRDLGEKRGSVG